MVGETRFSSWLKGYGVSRLVDDLRGQGCTVTQSAVYQWIEGRTVPRYEKALLMQRLSDGQMTCGAIYQHRDQLKNGPGMELRQLAPATP